MNNKLRHAGVGRSTETWPSVIGWVGTKRPFLVRRNYAMAPMGGVTTAGHASGCMLDVLHWLSFRVHSDTFTIALKLFILAMQGSGALLSGNLKEALFKCL